MKSSRTGAALALLLFIAALGGYVALRNLVTTTSARVVEIRKEIEEKNAETAHLASVRDRLAELAGVEQAVHAYFVPDTAVVAFINELQARGSAVGAAVEISSVSASPTDKNGHSTLKVALSITGSFDAVMRALGSIEYAPYDLSPASLSLIADPSKSVWTANTTLVVSSVKGATPSVPFATPASPASTTPSTATTTVPVVKKQP